MGRRERSLAGADACGQKNPAKSDDRRAHDIGQHHVQARADPRKSAGDDVAWGAAEHELGFLADRHDLLFAAIFGDRDHARLRQDDPAPFDVNKRVGGSKVDGHVGRHETQHTGEHTENLWQTVEGIIVAEEGGGLAPWPVLHKGAERQRGGSVRVLRKP